jgi:ribosomal protein S18 acetylase RimI-like enzyme
MNDWPSVRVERAAADDAPEVAEMVGELLNEIMIALGERVFGFDLDDTVTRLDEFITQGRYVVFVARDGGNNALGFVALYESHSLYAQGAFGTIPEFYVRAAYRSRGVGCRLMDRAKRFAAERGWKRLEVTTPPLPQFDRTLAFYQRQGFSITGGRKLKVIL